MSQLQSFSGKICVHCSKSNFILDNDKISYASSGASIQTDTRCPYCELKIKHRWVKQLANRRKVQEVTVANICPKFVINNNYGKLPGKGDIVEYICTDSQHQNPLRSGSNCIVNYLCLCSTPVWVQN